MRTSLPASPRDLFRFGPVQGVCYRALLESARLTGFWRYPAPTSGDLEDMRWSDVLYWLHKAGDPIRRAERGSGLETFFDDQRRHVWSLDDGFVVEQEVRLSAVGDLMPHTFLRDSAETLYGDEAVRDLIFGVDIAMANLESVVRPEASVDLEFNVGMKVGPPLTFEPRVLDVVGSSRGDGYDFMATACNHSLDFGEEGIASTSEALRQRGVAFHGMNETEQGADEMTVLDSGGVRLGVVSFTFGLNARKPPPGRPRIVNRMRLNGPLAAADVEWMKTLLAHGRRTGVEFVIAQLHWGLEFEFFPRLAQLDVAHALAELGVDLILGHHPHVVQPVEWYRPLRDPGRIVPIFYSLGNLTNPFSVDYMRRSGVARVLLARGTSRAGEPRVLVKEARLVAVDQVVDVMTQRLALRLAPSS